MDGRTRLLYLYTFRAQKALGQHQSRPTMGQLANSVVKATLDDVKGKHPICLSLAAIGKGQTAVRAFKLRRFDTTKSSD
jgi:hypothetical protein